MTKPNERSNGVPGRGGSVTETKTKTYTLALTSDELDWLLFEVIPTALRVYEKTDGSMATQLKFAKDQWWKDLSEQGYRPF